MEEKLALSVIVTTKDRQSDLKRCVESIKRAVPKEIRWELIIVDDNSLDGTRDLTLTDLGIKKGRIIHNRQTLMMVKSRNIGARSAGGREILFIDDDNVLEKKMIEELLKAAVKNKKFGIIGPSMCYLKSGKRYLDYQLINLATGKTSAKVDESQNIINESDGIPNVFMIKREVFAKCGYFDEDIIQTYTEPDFTFRARKFGYQSVITKKAKTFHSVTEEDNLSPRSLGGKFPQKAYCLIRNRFVIIKRYAKFPQKVVFLFFFSWFWPAAYSFMMIKYKRFDLIKYYWYGWKDGLKYLISSNLENSLPILSKK